MKKTIVSIIAIVALMCFAGSVFAAGAEKAAAAPAEKAAAAPAAAEVVKGKIVSIDAAKNEIVVKDEKANADKTVAVKAEEIKALKVGDVVNVELKAGAPAKVEVVKEKADKAKAK